MKSEKINISERVSIWIGEDFDLTIEDNFFDQICITKEEAIIMAELILIKYK